MLGPAASNGMCRPPSLRPMTVISLRSSNGGSLQRKKNCDLDRRGRLRRMRWLRLVQYGTWRGGGYPVLLYGATHGFGATTNLSAIDRLQASRRVLTVAFGARTCQWLASAP